MILAVGQVALLCRTSRKGIIQGHRLVAWLHVVYRNELHLVVSIVRHPNFDVHPICARCLLVRRYSITLA